jgi:hypothetical protein
MTEKRDLVVKLYVGNVLVDESTDVGLWQRVLSEIKGVPAPEVTAKFLDKKPATAAPVAAVGGAKAFADAIGITLEELIGGLDPGSEPPYIGLDSRCWEALKKNTPPRGQGSVSQTVLAATALVMWKAHQEFGDVTVAAVKAVMATIELDDGNAIRSIGNCDWLQMKGNRVVLNPSRLTPALAVLRAYCRREAISTEG